MNIAIIPARAGSKRIPGKNVRPFFGKPIIAYSIETARASRLFEEIVVSTDSPAYAAVAKGYGAKVHMRPAKLADDITGTQEVMRSALTWWKDTHRDPNLVPEIACCIYATAPMLRASDLIIAAANQPRHPYVYVSGYFYLGHALAFVGGVPIESGWEMPYPSERYVDINTEADWQRAERMYAELQERRAEQEVLQR